MPERDLYGWDIGGAHVKACRLVDGELRDVAQWPCPLWLGLDRLDGVFEQARARWPRLAAAAHAVTMTGEMVDLFEHREDGVTRIAAKVAERLAGEQPVRFFAGDLGWAVAGEAAAGWSAIASANWLATARHAALSLRRRAPAGEGVLIDIGSTTTDLIGWRAGEVLTRARTDAARLATSELVYHGVTRTPLCALGPRIVWNGAALNVMNEFFATTADVYRLTGELDPAHDPHPAADNAGKDAAATRRRLARMIGLDERDGSPDDWLTFARAWRECQVVELAGQLARVMALHGISGNAAFVSAGCGAFLAADVIERAAGVAAATRCLAYGARLATLADGAPAGLAAWAQVCAPCVAVATLLDREHR